MERLMEWQALQQLRQEHQESGQGRGENVQALRSWLFEEVTVSNMIRYMFAVTLGLISVAIPLRAANRPHAGTDRQNKMVWTNDDLDKLHTLGLISIVGRDDDQKSAPPPPPAQHLLTPHP